MNKTKQEQLSAFMDGEVDGHPRELADDLSRDPELLDTWSRYHLIADCLQGNMPEHMDRELAGKVAKSLEQEPAIVAPIRFPSTFMKPVTGFAIAASVAALAIFGIQQQQANVPHDMPADPLLQAVPGSTTGGNITAPARQVSAGNGLANRECETVGNGKEGTERVRDDELEEDCQ